MSTTRYGHASVGGGDQDQGERKDDGWQRRQGGDQSRSAGGDPSAGEGSRAPGGSEPPNGMNTQGDLAGIGEASAASTATLDRNDDRKSEPPRTRDRDTRGAGTDQPPRMGGPLGSDEDDPHIPEGEQNAANRGSGARGFDRGVDASRVGAVHQGARTEDVD